MDHTDDDRIEVTTEPVAAAPGRVERARERTAAWRARAKLLEARAAEERRRHGSVDAVFEMADHDSEIGGGIMAGALAYRLFIWLLPLALVAVAGLGFAADAASSTPESAAESMGMLGLVSNSVANAAESFGPLVRVADRAAPARLRDEEPATDADRHPPPRVDGPAPSCPEADPDGNSAAPPRTDRLLRDLRRRGLRTEPIRARGGSSPHSSSASPTRPSGSRSSTRLPHRDAPWRALIPGAVLIGIGVEVFHVVTAYFIAPQAETQTGNVRLARCRRDAPLRALPHQPARDRLGSAERDSLAAAVVTGRCGSPTRGIAARVRPRRRRSRSARRAVRVGADVSVVGMATEQAQDLHRMVAGRPEPVRQAGVELGNLARRPT